MSLTHLSEGPLGLRLRLWWRKLPMLVLVPLSISGVGLWLFLFRPEEIAQAVGPNLIADGLMLLVALFLIEKLAEARMRRQRAGRLLVIYRDLRSIYTLILSLWGILLFVASRIQEEDLSSDDFAKAFDQRISSQPFSKASVELIRHVGEAIANHSDKESILATLQRIASDVSKRIEDAQRRHDNHFRPDLFLVLEELRTSVLLGWLGGKANFDLYALGGNLLFTAEENRDLMTMFNHIRDDPRSLNVLPKAEDYNIQELIPLLGDHVDRLAGELLLRDAYLVPRTISPESAYYR